MSYSFSARGATKAEVMEKVIAELDKVVAGQPMHAADRDAAMHAANVFVDVVPLNDAQQYQVSVSGSVSWNATGDGNIVTAANVNVSVGLIAK